MIELDRIASGVNRMNVHDDIKLSDLFQSTHAALKFITRNDRLPEPVVTEASLAAVKVISGHKEEKRREALARFVRRKTG